MKNGDVEKAREREREKESKKGRKGEKKPFCQSSVLLLILCLQCFQYASQPFLLGENIRPLAKQGPNTKPECILDVELGLQLLGFTLAWVRIVPLVG